MAALADLVASRFGLRTQTHVNRSASSVGTSVAEVLRQDGARLAATLVNLGAAAIYVLPDEEVSSSRGIRLGPSGGSVALTWETDFELVGYAWHAVADAAATALLTIEVVAR